MRDTGSKDPITDFLKNLDYLQIFCVGILLGIGLIFIRSTGLQVDTPASREFFSKQLQWIVFGSVLYIFFAAIDYRKPLFRIGTFFFYLLCLILLILVLIIGVKVFGATRWLSVGSFRLQPSEPAKLGLIAIISGLFSAKIFQQHRGLTFLISSVLLGVPFILIALEPDLGSALILLPVYFPILFCAGVKWRYVIAGFCALLAVLSVVYVDCSREKPILLHNYQRDRIRVFLHPDSDRSNRGHNAYQAKLAVGSGGLSGKGIGEGTQNELGFLPHTVSNNDFIFSVIAEETGISGVMALLTAFAILLYTMLRTAVLADTFGRYLAVGAAIMIFCHIFINIGMSIGLAPVTGLPLPLVSYGGSFTLTAMALCGLLQSIYRHRPSDEDK